MKKHLSRLGVLLITGLISLVFTACGDDEPAEESREVVKVNLNRSTLALKPGESEILSADVFPVNALDKTVTWESSNTAVATVDGDGTVTAVTSGMANITAKAGEKSATCVVTVIGIAVTDISLPATLNTWVSAVQALTITIKPDDATDKTITWTTSNSAVATVDKDGKLTAVGAGTATITATSASGSKTATCTVNIKAIPAHGVLINGVVWAKYAMTEEGGIVSMTEGSGMFYQWNRKKSWATTGDATGWDNSADRTVDWARENDPCPAGWRIPTLEQVMSLSQSGRTIATVDGVPGIRFGSGDNSLFLPSAGYRNWQVGQLGDVGTWGRYWARPTASETRVVYLEFSTTGQVGVNIRSEDHIRASGQCIRCVAE